MGETHPTGIGVDATGGPVIDPTANVISLTEAAVKRLDDLRDAESRRVNELREAESRRIDEQAALRAEYADKLAVAEAKRIDAIRAVDVNAVAVASQRQSDQATVLANQVVQSAEALRSLVATTAAAQQQASQQITGALSDRISQLEKSSYEGAGKGTGAKNLWAILAVAIGLLATLFMVAIAVGGVIVAVAK